MKHDIQTGICSCCHLKNPEPTEKERELRRAYGVIRKMNNPKVWRVHLFHNIHWCWYIVHVSGYLSVHVSTSVGERDSYWTMMTDKPDNCGSGIPEWLTGFQSNDPNAAVDNQMAVVRRSIARRKQAYDTILKMTESAI